MNFDLKEVAFYGRRLAEYVEMFGLDISTLVHRKVLDCAAGPASFAAEAVQLGVDVVACDPLYNLSAVELYERAADDLETTLQRISKATHLCTVSSNQLSSLRATREAANQLFLNHVRASTDTGCYVASGLPSLPFPDKTFDLVLTGHFLFTYTDQLDGGCMVNSPYDSTFHQDSILELLRVSQGPVLIYPAHTIMRPRRICPSLAGVLEQINERVPIKYEFVESTYARQLEYPDDLNVMVRTGRWV
eukprot:TRINITY_DN907_c0_g1_i3.p1 TRINITY_DN907_c0_g1~~TRINITY_DN907_c0_g1_i3.p1  ORF type:complete len:247 (+),score=16.92 TRINITY_DN907_c0_g1_i3:1399-2139(+)